MAAFTFFLSLPASAQDFDAPLPRALPDFTPDTSANAPDANTPQENTPQANAPNTAPDATAPVVTDRTTPDAAPQPQTNAPIGAGTDLPGAQNTPLTPEIIAQATAAPPVNPTADNPTPNEAPFALPPLSDPTAQSGFELPGGDFTVESPGGLIYDAERGVTVAQGPVTLKYREFTVRGDKGVIDNVANKAKLSGNLTINVRGRTLTGQSLTFDFNTGQWVLSQIQTTFEPELFPPGSVLQPIFVTGQTVTGQYDTLRGNNFDLSTCDRGHYYLRSKKLSFYRDRNGEPSRIALKKSALYVFGHKILPLPAYVISLNGQRSRNAGLQPTFGRNDVDGYFAKTIVDLAATVGRTDSLLIDALEKRGLGLGFNRELASGAGLYYLYAVSGKGGAVGGRQIDARVRRLFQISDILSSTVNFNSTQNNGFGINNTNRNLDLSLNRAGARAQTDLFVRTSNNASQGSSFNDLSTTLSHRQEFGQGLSFQADSLYSTSRSSGIDATTTTDNSAQLARTTPSFDALARIELHNDLSANRQGSSIYQLSRLPELTLQSDTERLKLPILSSYIPGDFGIGLGVFNEPSFDSETSQPVNKNLSRADIAYNARPQERQILQLGAFRSALTSQGRFEQALYSNNTAKYDYNYGFNLNNQLGALSAQLNYFKTRTYGFTPFQFDFSTPSEYFDANLAFRPSAKFQVNLQTGRDIQNGINNDIVGRLQFAPNANYYASVSTNYSQERHELGDVIGNFRLARDTRKFGGGTLDFGIRYSPQMSRISQANASAGVFFGRRTFVEGLTSYNGFTRSFDQTQIRVTRDLHCFNLYTTYDSFRKQLRFDLALKAFPYADTRYGIGQFGQAFDTRLGGVQ